MRFLQLLGDILNSLSIFCALLSRDESNLLPPVSRNNLNFQIIIVAPFSYLMQEAFRHF
eukprot:UN05395